MREVQREAATCIRCGKDAEMLVLAATAEDGHPVAIWLRCPHCIVHFWQAMNGAPAFTPEAAQEAYYRYNAAVSDERRRLFKAITEGRVIACLREPNSLESVRLDLAAADAVTLRGLAAIAAFRRDHATG